MYQIKCDKNNSFCVEKIIALQVDYQFKILMDFVWIYNIKGIKFIKLISLEILIKLIIRKLILVQVLKCNGFLNLHENKLILESGDYYKA